MVECVLNNQGTLDKYIGDAVMAIYGAPVPLENHPQQACISALNMIETLHDIEQKVAHDVPALIDLFPIKIGIGIHTGEVVVGNLGSSLQFNYTVIGDSVNLASRLEGLTKNYGCDIIVSEVTQALVKDQFFCRELDLVRVKGKTKPIGLYELLGEKSSINDRSMYVSLKLELWQQAFVQYRQFDFEGALVLFKQYHHHFKHDKAALLYIDRCDHFMAEPPPDHWDGVFTYTTK
jgi:adenylate cyclase